jgi:hypothetical protein
MNFKENMDGSYLDRICTVGMRHGGWLLYSSRYSPWTLFRGYVRTPFLEDIGSLLLGHFLGMDRLVSAGKDLWYPRVLHEDHAIDHRLQVMGRACILNCQRRGAARRSNTPRSYKQPQGETLTKEEEEAATMMMKTKSSKKIKVSRHTRTLTLIFFAAGAVLLASLWTKTLFALLSSQELPGNTDEGMRPVLMSSASVAVQKPWARLSRRTEKGDAILDAAVRAAEGDPASIASTSISSSNTSTTGVLDGTSPEQLADDFDQQPKAVIVLKVHDFRNLGIRQSLCLLTQAYNKRTKHDIVIFVTIAPSEKESAEFAQIVHPASLTIVPDKQTLQEQLEDLTKKQQETLIGRCNNSTIKKNNITTIKDLTWETMCNDGPFEFFQIRYYWMAEFRSKHIWQQEALKKYRYMLWFDTDSFCTQPWKQDPIAFMIRNNLVLLMGDYGNARANDNSAMQERLFKAYNKTLCKGKIRKTDGRMEATYGDGGEDDRCKSSVVYSAPGFFHVTDLDFYRLPQNMHYYDVLLGDGKFQRRWEDQLAVIGPAVMGAPERTMEMEPAGIFPEVMHNGFMMSKRKNPNGTAPKYHFHYTKSWNATIANEWPEAQEACNAYIKLDT